MGDNRIGMERTSAMTNETPDRLADDMLEGADAIAAFMGWKIRRVYHLHDKGGWPIFTDGSGKISARKSSLHAFVERLENAAIARGAGRQLAEGAGEAA